MCMFGPFFQRGFTIMLMTGFPFNYQFIDRTDNFINAVIQTGENFKPILKL